MKDDFKKLFPDNRTEGETILRQSQLVMLRILKIVDHICKKNNIKYWLDSGTLIGAIRHNGFIPWDDDIDICMPREDYNRFIKIAKSELPDDLFLQTQETDIEYDHPWAKVRDNNSIIKEYKPGNYHKGIFIDIFPVDCFSTVDNKTIKYKGRFKRIYRTLTLIKEPLEPNSNKKLFFKNIWKIVMRTLLFPYALMSREAIFKKLEKTKSTMSKEITDSNGDYVSYGLELIYWPSYYGFKIEKSELFPLTTHTFEDGEFMVPKNYDLYLKNIYGNYMELPPEDQRIYHNQGIYPILDADNFNVSNYNNNNNYTESM